MSGVSLLRQRWEVFEVKRKSVKRPTGVTIIAVLTFCGAAILALGSFGLFFVAVMGMSGGDAGQPTSVAIAGMGIAGGFSLGSRQRCGLSGDWRVGIARMGADRINRIHCRGYWVHDFQHFRFLELQIDSDCGDDCFPSACDGYGCLYIGVLGAAEREAGVSPCDRVDAKVYKRVQISVFSLVNLASAL
jgi:hypothetical protein